MNYVVEWPIEGGLARLKFDDRKRAVAAAEGVFRDLRRRTVVRHGQSLIYALYPNGTNMKRSHRARRRRNPSEYNIYLPGEVIQALSEWHGGQSSATYSLASTGRASTETLNDAISELRRIKRSGKATQTGMPYKIPARDWKHLKELIGELEMIAAYPDEWRM